MWRGVVGWGSSYVQCGWFLGYGGALGRSMGWVERIFVPAETSELITELFFTGIRTRHARNTAAALLSLASKLCAGHGSIIRQMRSFIVTRAERKKARHKRSNARSSPFTET